MRLGLWGLIGLFLGAFTAHFLLRDNGYVLINFQDYVVEMSVPGLVIVLIAAYLAVRGALMLWRSPRRLGEALAERRAQRAGQRLTRGLIRIVEGDWARGERLLTRGLKGADAPLVNYLMAARAAQLQGAGQRRDEWLELAYDAQPEAETAVLLTQAELQLGRAEFERALATLQRITETRADHPVALALLARTYRALRDWEQLVGLLPRLGSARLDVDELERLAGESLEAHLPAADLTREQLTALWGRLPARVRRSSRALRVYALTLDRLGHGGEAEKALRSALKQEWRPSLVLAYGELKHADPVRQLKRAEGWLKERPEDGALLLTAARLCIAGQLWGKARSYLESSLALAPTAESYALYGRLLNQLGEREDAAIAFRSGLGLVARGGPELPVLAAPERAEPARD